VVLESEGRREGCWCRWGNYLEPGWLVEEADEDPIVDEIPEE
jgi:hypothetical protein